MRTLGCLLSLPAGVITCVVLYSQSGLSSSAGGFAISIFCGFLVTWGISSGCTLIGEAAENKSKARANAAAERANAAAEIERQKNRLSSLLDSTQRTFLSIPELVASADLHLERAEHEFGDGAFAPFWDEVEHATNKLAAFHEAIRSVSNNANDYEQSASKLTINIPKFTLPEGELPDARPVAERLTQIVRSAQRNFQFSTIYEQRKTNQLLYAGFGTLGMAISSIGDSISLSLDELSRSVHSSLDEILIQASTDSNARREFEKKVLATESEQAKMLDNIQRKRKPR